MANITYGQQIQLLPELLTQFNRADRIDLIVSFVMKSGIALLERHLRQAALSGVKVRVLTSTYMNITDPTALTLLGDCLGENGEIRLYNGDAGSFHPKAYVFHGHQSDCIYVGSSNVSKSALTDGVEWNYKIEKSQDRAAFDELSGRFNYLFEYEGMPMTDEILKDYRDFYVKSTIRDSNINKHYKKYQKEHKKSVYEEVEADLSGVAQGLNAAYIQPIFHPNDAQLEALIELKRTRLEGNHKALVIAATGLAAELVAKMIKEHFDL